MKKSDLLVAYQRDLARARSEGARGWHCHWLLRECLILRRTLGRNFPDIV